MNEYNSQLIRTAKIYLQNNIPLILFHGTTHDGICSCGKSECTAAGKHPVFQNPLATQILDISELEIQLRDNVDRNIAGWILPGTGLVIVDVDKRNGGIESFERLIKTHGPLPPTLKVISGGNGFHLYFKIPKEYEAKSFPNKFLGFEGIDLLRNKNAILPGSRHKSGNYYRFDSNKESQNFEIAYLPERYLDLLLFKIRKEVIHSPEVIPEGERNSSLWKRAVSFFKQGMPEDDIVAKISEINQSQCNDLPPIKRTQNSC